ncbi:MAG: glycosyltransferase family 2 protein [Holosporales bacterium]|nr:glycosyltransferase family 2 protein [Holosporales bacterium]
MIASFLDEEGAIPKFYRDLNTVLSGAGFSYEMVLIDDGSQDETPSLLEALAEKDEHLTVLFFPITHGKTAAMMAGFDYAQGEIVVTMDGDNQDDPNDIPRLLEKIDEGYDAVSGWRKNRQDRFLSRRLPSFFANKLISFVSGVKLNDYGCALKAYRRSLLADMKLYGEMHRFVPIYAKLAGARVAEVPVNHFPRLTGRSKVGAERVIKVVLDLIVVKFLQQYLVNPIYFMGGFGLFCIGSGVVAFLVATYLKVFEGGSYIGTPLPLLSITCVLLGGVSILVGLLAEVMTRSYYESQGKKTYIVGRCFRGKKSKEV